MNEVNSLISNLDFDLVALGAILFISVYASKISEKIGIPLLLIFLAFGMILGSEGIIGIEFEDYHLARVIGTIALVFILYSGGLETRWDDVRGVIGHGAALAALGVLLTALIMAAFIYFVLDFSFLEALLLGSIVSSTDAAAVFMILRSQSVRLKNGIDSLLELESGSNDPMAIFLTVMVLELLTIPSGASASEWAFKFILQFALGGALGAAGGYIFPRLVSNLKLGQIGLYPLISVAWLFIMFGLSSYAGGNGYLAIYIAGILINKFEFPHKESMVAFHNAIAWMMQITVFLVLGLLVFPSNLPSVAFKAILLALILIFIARPISVFITLFRSRYEREEKLYISWVGLRGAVPIILATYPYLYGIEQADTIFNMVFFMVLISVSMQGMSITFMAKKLHVAEDK